MVFKWYWMITSHYFFEFLDLQVTLTRIYHIHTTPPLTTHAIVQKMEYDGSMSYLGSDCSMVSRSHD